MNQPQTPENKNITINLEQTQGSTPYQHPHQSGSTWLTIAFNSLLLAFITALVVQCLVLIPFALPGLERLPFVGLGSAAFITGIFWALNQRINVALTCYSLALCIGCFLGL